MAREDLHFRLRIPEELKDRIENAAQKNERSMTAEIIARLQWTFGPADEEMVELLEKLQASETRADALLDELNGRRVEIHHLRDRLEKDAFELRMVREKLAGQEGANAYMSGLINRFIRELVGDEANGAALRQRFMDLINEPPPAEQDEE